MIYEIRQVLNRSRATIWQDMIGGTALMIGLIGILHLPAIF